MALTLGDTHLDRITARTRQASPARSAVAVIAGVLFGIGWIAARFLGALWFAIVWCAMAVSEGWREARVKRGPAGTG